MSDIKFRYENNSISLTKNLRPQYSDDWAMSFYSFPQDKKNYITTERYFPSVEKTYNIRNCLKTERDALFAFWNTYLSYGQNMFTIIDQRKRCLFNTLWDSFGSPESWNANRSSHNIEMKVQNPFGWTSPLHGVYLFPDNAATEYLGTGINPSLSAGVLTDYATDNQVLRFTGNCIKMLGNNDETHQCGAQVYPVWKSSNGKPNITLFCQFAVNGFQSNGGLTDNEFDILNLSDGTNSFGITACGDANNMYLIGFIETAEGFSRIQKLNGDPATCDTAVWYDLAVTYDGVDNKAAFYYCPSAMATFTDFLDSKTDIEDGILSNMSNDYHLPNTTWNNMKIMYESTDNVLLHGGSASFIQNIFVIDGYVSAFEFNFYRRLCNFWNRKTDTFWPK